MLRPHSLAYMTISIKKHLNRWFNFCFKTLKIKIHSVTIVVCFCFLPGPQEKFHLVPKPREYWHWFSDAAQNLSHQRIDGGNPGPKNGLFLIQHLEQILTYEHLNKSCNSIFWKKKKSFKYCNCTVQVLYSDDSPSNSILPSTSQTLRSFT